MAQLTFKIDLRRPFHSKEDGALFLRLFLRHFPNHVPTKFGNAINPTDRFDANDLDSVLKNWNRRDFGFEGDNLSLAGQVVRPRPSIPHLTHTQIFVYAFEDDPQSLKSFLYKSASAFWPDCATAHILTRVQLERRLRANAECNRKRSPAVRASFEERLQEQLDRWPKRRVLGPEISTLNVQRGHNYELYWLTIFGPPFVELFGRKRILSTPAHEVRELEYGGIGLELTNGLEDTPEAWDAFLAARARAEKHLNSNAFLSLNLQ